MKKVRVAVIGCGVIGPLHIECYKSLKNAEIAWLCDLEESKARAAAAKYELADTRITASAARIFADPAVDAVSICTDHASHADLVAAALKSGKAVLCEKALAQNSAALKKILLAAERYPAPVFSGVFQHRFDPINRELKKILEERVFGTLLTAGIQLRCYRSDEYYKADPWRGTFKYEGGSILINQAIHYIDQLLWLTGGFEKVVGATANLTHQGVIETEDTAAAVLRLKNGAIGTIDATCSSNINWESTISLHGSEGALEIRDDKIAKINFKDKRLEARVAKRLERAIAPKSAKSGKTYYGSGHLAQIADFVAAVAQNRAPFVTGQSAAATAAAIFAIYEAAKKV